MIHQLSRTVVIAVATLFLASMVAMAAGEMVSGTVEKMDSAKGTISIKSSDGKTVELQATPELLVGLQRGDAVQVSTSGTKATAIRKSATGGTPGASPGGTPGTPPRSQ